MSAPARFVEITEPYEAAFAIVDGELVETVELDEAGAWDWSWAEICDPHLGSDPDLQAEMRARLDALDG